MMRSDCNNCGDFGTVRKEVHTSGRGIKQAVIQCDTCGIFRIEDPDEDDEDDDVDEGA